MRSMVGALRGSNEPSTVFRGTFPMELRFTGRMSLSDISPICPP